MYYDIITTEYPIKLERENVYTMLIGLNAIRRFEGETGKKIIDDMKPMKEQGGNKVLPYISVRFYNGKPVDYCYFVRYIVRYEGGYYLPSHEARKGKPCSFTILEDAINYNLYGGEWDKHHPAPNKVGVVTDKKMAQWAEYLRDRHDAALVNMHNKNNKVKLFLAKLESINPGSCKIFNCNERKGIIKKSGFCYSYLIDPSGYIFEKIEVDSDVNHNFETFAEITR